MEVVTRYKANDGTEFNEIAACRSHEKLLDKISNIMRGLESINNPIESNEYLQQKTGVVRGVLCDLLELSKEFVSHKWIQQTIDDENIDLSWSARIIGECCTPMITSFNRIQCIDGSGKEWQQIYYVNNPPSGAKCLNPNLLT